VTQNSGENMSTSSLWFGIYFYHDRVMWNAPDQWHYARGLGWVGCPESEQGLASEGLETNFHVSHMRGKDYNPHAMIDQFTPTRNCDFQVTLAEYQHRFPLCPTGFPFLLNVTWKSVFVLKTWMGKLWLEIKVFLKSSTNQVKCKTTQKMISSPK